MKVYHMSQTLKLGEELQTGYNGNAERCDAFVKALEKGEDCIHSMIVCELLVNEFTSIWLQGFRLVQRTSIVRLLLFTQLLFLYMVYG